MDYETIIYDHRCCPKTKCEIRLDHELLWTKGEVINLVLPIFGGIWIEADRVLVTPEGFLKGSNTKYVRMTLSNFLGEVVNTQIAKPDSDIDFKDGVATCYFSVDKELSDSLKSGSYFLEVSMVNTLPEVEDYLPERTIFDLMVSPPGGLNITIL